MTVEELILELQYLPKDLDVSVVDYSKKRFKEHRDIRIQLAVPEFADPYVQIQLNVKE